MKVLPAPSVTEPRLAVMVPELRTCGATSAANPPFVAVIEPRLVIEASGRPGLEKLYLPAKKSPVPMPDVVAKGRQDANPPVFACGLCHYPNGKGRPENANVTGLSYEYIVQQLKDFREGARKTSDPRKANTATTV